MKTAQPHITEKQFQSQVEQAARILGWLVYHTYDSRRCERGYPDLTMCHPVKRRIIFAELKSQRGRGRPEQYMWLTALDACPGVEVFMWRPSDWDEIVEILR